MKTKLLFLAFFINFLFAKAQSTSPVVIASSGDYFFNANYSVAWTLGEVVSETYTTSNYFLTQGFHQPNAIKPLVKEEPIDFYNGFSPNGDGKNDSWLIPVLNNYPNNSVLIINRWGDEVWLGNNYDNKSVIWTGKNMTGDELPDGTYYYIIYYNNIKKQGWVFIKR
jgi:gliding motility-associated-like protein